MSRPKKDYRALSLKLASPIHDKLDQFCAESGLSKTGVVEMVLDRFLNDYFRKTKKERQIFR